MRYFHNEDLKMTVSVQAPKTEPITGKGKGRIGWKVRAEVTITRADNCFSGGRWRFDVMAHPTAHLHGDYTREEALSYFDNYLPDDRGREVTKDVYDQLTAEYEAMAWANRPAS